MDNSVRLRAGVTELEERPASLEERWILARLSATQGAIEEYLAQFDFAHLVDELYHLTFDDFCDWYLEAIKPRIYGGDADALATAGAALERLLELLHPVMPHVTEEIWSNLPERRSRLIVAAWPAAGDTAEGGALDLVKEAAERFRRSGIPAQLEGEEKRIFDAVVKPERQKANGNVEAERERLRKEVERAERMLGNPGFTDKAPAEVVQAEREKLERYRRELDGLGG